MKNAAFIFFLASFSSLVAAGSNDVMKNLGDPIRGQPSPQQPSFSLSKGYFSLFDIFKISVVTPQPDTAKSKFEQPKGTIQKKIEIKRMSSFLSF